MSFTLSLSNQLANSIVTLQKTIELADDITWSYGEPPFFQIGFHTINALDMYFSTFEDKYTNLPEEYMLPDYMHRYEILGFFDNEGIDSQDIIPKELLLKYLKDTRSKIREIMNTKISTQFEDPSGFTWLKMTKFELIIHNIRHVMGHTGVLNEYLKANDRGISGWIGRAEL